MSPTTGDEGQGKPDRSSRLVGQVMQDDREYVWGRMMRDEIKEEARNVERTFPWRPDHHQECVCGLMNVVQFNVFQITHGSQCAQVTIMIQSHWREQDKIQKLYIGIERVIDVNELDK